MLALLKIHYDNYTEYLPTLELYFCCNIFLLDLLNDLEDLNDDNYFKDDLLLYEDTPHDSAMERIYKTSKQALGNKLQRTLHVIVHTIIFLKLSHRFSLWYNS